MEGNITRVSSMADSTEQTADFVTILSSDLIAEIVEVHFNKVMYKKNVKIVDLKPTSDGYAFSLAYVDIITGNKKEVNVEPVVQSVMNGIIDEALGRNGRDSKGKFTSKQMKKTITVPTEGYQLNPIR